MADVKLELNPFPYKCSNAECRREMQSRGYCAPCKAEYNARWEITNAQHRRAYWKARRRGLPRPKKKSPTDGVASEAQPSMATQAHNCRNCPE